MEALIPAFTTALDVNEDEADEANMEWLAERVHAGTNARRDSDGRPDRRPTEGSAQGGSRDGPLRLAK